MDGTVEHEICANCKKEIPHYNYVMHTAHCSRNITLCPVCKEPIPKNQFEAHRKLHTTNVKKIDEKLDFPKQLSKAPASQASKPAPKKDYSFKGNENIRKDAPREDSRRKDSTSGLRHSSSDDNRSYSANSYSVKQSNHVVKTESEKKQQKSVVRSGGRGSTPPKSQTSSLLACKFCDLELPKLELESHENYCGARTDKCNECGELVMFKYKKLHEETNHGFLKLNDEPGPRPTWDSDTQRPVEPSYMRRQRPAPIYTVNSFDFSPVYTYGTIGVDSLDADNNNGEKRETYKDISRRLDCKTEYIRNLLHDSASITVPLRRSGTVPRNHFYHDKGPAPQPPSRRRNPPTELVIPCEFCNTPIPHEELIQHETGCRPDLARFNPRRRSPSPEDYFVAPEPSSPDVDLPCEFCADMFPASELLRHQATCN